MQAVGEFLRGKGVRFTPNTGVRGAEELPLAMLPRLHAMKDGEIEVFDEGGGRLQVVRLSSSTPAPVDLATATPSIRQFLLNRTVKAALDEKLKQVKAAAQITYFGEFSGEKGTLMAKGAATAPPRADASSPEAQAGGTAPKQLEPIIAKGIRGLR